MGADGSNGGDFLLLAEPFVDPQLILAHHLEKAYLVHIFSIQHWNTLSYLHIKGQVLEITLEFSARSNDGHSPGIDFNSNAIRHFNRLRHQNLLHLLEGAYTEPEWWNNKKISIAPQQLTWYFNRNK